MGPEKLVYVLAAVLLHALVSTGSVTSRISCPFYALTGTMLTVAEMLDIRGLGPDARTRTGRLRNLRNNDNPSPANEG